MAALKTLITRQGGEIWLHCEGRIRPLSRSSRGRPYCEIVPASTSTLPTLPSQKLALEAARATLQLLPSAAVAVAEAWRAVGRVEDADRLIASVAAHVARQHKQQRRAA